MTLTILETPRDKSRIAEVTIQGAKFTVEWDYEKEGEDFGYIEYWFATAVCFNGVWLHPDEIFSETFNNELDAAVAALHDNSKN